ncbi:hypothetical protein [Acidobacterium sp. S8]|uniref:hypothetical protein n=1 Tax=Acidobacterium sp. S8 TaxID=1641854 RepID=UPI001C209842|nr:hypothetical protein [Acidobacterium sp. S8]
MTSMNFIGLDIHKKTISYCVKDISAKVQSEGKIPATRQGLREWVGTLAKPWTVAMEATMFNLPPGPETRDAAEISGPRLGAERVAVRNSTR